MSKGMLHFLEVDFQRMNYSDFIDSLIENGAPVRYDTLIKKEDLNHMDIEIYGNLEVHLDIKGDATYVWWLTNRYAVMENEMSMENLDKMYLEYSNITEAKTAKEIKLENIIINMKELYQLQREKIERLEMVLRESVRELWLTKRLIRLLLSI